jgi:hypothetical protein
VTVVVDHLKKRVVWVGEGKGEKTLLSFFDELVVGPVRAERPPGGLRHGGTCPLTASATPKGGTRALHSLARSFVSYPDLSPSRPTFIHDPLAASTRLRRRGLRRTRDPQVQQEVPKCSAPPAVH